MLGYDALATINVPSYWRNHAKAVKTVNDCIVECTVAYNELKTEGPVSVKHLMERMKVAEDKGVAWPAPVYPLLDDIMGRTARL